MNLNNKELSTVIGGSITGSPLAAALNIGKTIFDIGCQVGRTIRRLIFG